MRLPRPRGPVSEHVLGHLAGPVRPVPPVAAAVAEPLADDDLQLALYVLYELHYRGFDAVDEAWEWEPSLLAVRRELERLFESALLAEVPSGEGEGDGGGAAPMDVRLRAIVDADDGPSLSRHLRHRGTAAEFREFVVHRSAYQLKEADPHAWALPRLSGAPKAALVDIQLDEYGDGVESRMHASLFRDTMEALGLDGAYGAYLDLIPGVTLATVNLMSMFGLHRSWRGAIVGQLAAFEMTSAIPNRRYAAGLRRLGLGSPRATGFYDEHVEADAVHENVAATDLAGGLAAQEPALSADILFGARCLVELDARFARHLLDAWGAGRGSLRAPLEPAVPA